MKKAEFDLFAGEYRAMHEKSLGNFSADQDYFAEYKVADVASTVEAMRPLSPVRDILDFGAGCGNAVPYFRRYFRDSDLTCLDVSEESLEIGRASYGGEAEFVAFDGTAVPMPDGRFDVAFSACVFHHIDHGEHASHLGEIHRLLRDDGLIFIFEHNPLNPLTVRVVNQCPFDVNAHLIRAGVMKERIVAAGFVDVTIRYRLFFPRMLRAFRPLERGLAWLPLGAQYFVVGRRPGRKTAAPSRSDGVDRVARSL